MYNDICKEYLSINNIILHLVLCYYLCFPIVINMYLIPKDSYESYNMNVLLFIMH